MCIQIVQLCLFILTLLAGPICLSPVFLMHLSDVIYQQYSLYAMSGLLENHIYIYMLQIIVIIFGQALNRLEQWALFLDLLMHS